MLTSALFYTFGGATNALARLIPALTGSALILLPVLFRERLKPRTAVILAFALALEPGLASISRQAGSPIMAVAFVLAAWGLWERRQVQWAGVCAGLALLSGPALWAGLLGLAITWALLRPFERSERKDAARPATFATAAQTHELVHRRCLSPGYHRPARNAVHDGAWRLERGSAACLSILPAGRAPSDITFGVMLGSLVAVPAAGGPARAHGHDPRMAAGQRADTPAEHVDGCGASAGALLSLTPGGGPGLDADPSVVAGLAGGGAGLNVEPADRREVLGAVALTCIILTFMWLDFLALRRPGIPPEQTLLRTWLLIGSFFLLVISLLLVGVGWSPRSRCTAHVGAGRLPGYLFGVLMAAAGHRNLTNSAEMWRPGAQLPMADLLLSTVQEQSAWSNLDPTRNP